MQHKKRSPFAAIVLAVIIGLLVVALLEGVIRPVDVVTAKVAMAPGTILTDQLVELRTIPLSARPADAFTQIQDVVGKALAVGRAPGDFIMQSVLGEVSNAGIPSQLPAGHLALAIHVDLASGVAGLLRPGQTVTVIGMISPDLIKDNTANAITQIIPPSITPTLSSIQAFQTPTPTPTPVPPSSPLARIDITGLRVLMVPQSFRYEELPAGASQDQLFSSAQASLSAGGTNVIVLDVPTGPVELTPGFSVNPATLLAALDQYGAIRLALEPDKGLGVDTSKVLTLNLGELYQDLNAGSKK